MAQTQTLHSHYKIPKCADKLCFRTSELYVPSHSRQDHKAGLGQLKQPQNEHLNLGVPCTCGVHPRDGEAPILKVAQSVEEKAKKNQPPHFQSLQLSQEDKCHRN